MATLHGSGIPYGSVDGPWAGAVWFDVPVPFVSKSNHRFTGRGDQTWARIRSFEDTVGLLARAARPEAWLMGSSEDKIADRPRIVLLLTARTTLDAPNTFKSVADALGGEILYVDDAQVAYCGALVEKRTRTDEGGRIAVAVLEPGTSNEDVMAAAAALTTAIL